MAHARVSDSGFNAVAVSALYGSRPYQSSSKRSEAEALDQASRFIVIKVPASIVEQARPYLTQG